MKKKVSIVIGRFQPFHNGHLALVDQATKDCDILVVVLGSADRPADIKNPFTEADRAQMITNVVMENFKDRNFAIRFVAVHDHDDDQKWLQELRTRVAPIIEESDVTLFGHKKDDSSYYLDLFPTWEYNEVAIQEDGLSATDIRKQLLKYNKIPKERLPSGVIHFLEHWHQSREFRNLKAEWNLVAKQNKAWEKAPRPVAWLTADAVVIHNGRVLMVKRGAHPGKGLLAIPGGYMNVKNETLLECAVRELEEETGLKVDADRCLNPLKNPIIFDAPSRSVRGRIVTGAFLWVLDPTSELPEVIGGDDADKAFWFPLEDLPNSGHRIFEDHQLIINKMMKLI